MSSSDSFLRLSLLGPGFISKPNSSPFIPIDCLVNKPGKPIWTLTILLWEFDDIYYPVLKIINFGKDKEE